MMNKIKTYIIFALVVLLLTTCKKYPENTLWFKNIKKIEFLNEARLTGFTVNGIDSLELLNTYFGSRVIDKDIKTTGFNYTLYRGEKRIHFISGTPGPHIPIYETYSRNKKKIAIIFGENGNWDTTVIHRNIFIDSTPWDIIKFEPKGIRKIRKTVNGNNYLLQFEYLIK